MRLQVLAVAVFGLASTLAFGDGEACGTAPVVVDGEHVDVTPPPGWVDICMVDKLLCQKLTAGYPPSAVTVGYFVPAAEWGEFGREHVGFRDYRIAQLATSMKPQMLMDYRAYVRERAGNPPDHTEPPPGVLVERRIGLGIVDDAPDAVTTGFVLKARTVVPPIRDISHVAMNSLVVVGQRVLTLYVFREYHDEQDVIAATEAARRWLTCLRRANPRGGRTRG